MTAIGILGANGRMGQAIAAAIAGDGNATLAGGCDLGEDYPRRLAELSGRARVLVDFTTPAALPAHLAAARAAGVALVVGTTGLSPADHAAIDETAHVIPLLQTGNTSLGVNLLAHLVRDAAARLGPEWDVEIVEMHHRHKVDAPSGTALLLGEAAAAGRDVALDAVAARGRDGITGARPVGAIGFASLRGGSVAGDHQVILATDGERIELGHRAESREIFARGAVKAALWLAGRPAGRYAMGDVLGL